MSVRVNFEIGHEAAIRTKKTVEGFTHDWEVFVRGCDGTQLPYFVEKVVFYLHETFPNPKRVVKQPPYVVKESGYAGFVLPIEVHVRHDPKRVKLHYDLTLQSSGPAVRNVQKEQYVFKNPTDELKSCLLRGGGVLVSSNSIHDTPDSRASSESKNELVNKPKLSGSDNIMKKHRNRMDEQRSSNSFQDLFGTPITKTNKVFSDPKSASKDGTVKPGSNTTSNSKPDKDRDKSKEKNKFSPNKEREKDREGEKRKDKQESDRRKEREEKKNKDNNRDRIHSKEKLSKREKSPRPTPSPSPKRSPKRPSSPKRPPSPPPVKYKEKEEKRPESSKEREKKDKSDEKTDKKSKKEKRDKEHKESRSKERESQKNSEHKEHKSKEKNMKEVVKEGESPSSRKSEKKEKKEKESRDEKEMETKVTPPSPERTEKKREKSEEKKEKHKHKKKDREKKEKDKDKKEKLKEKDKPVIKREVEVPKPELKEEKESLFAASKIEDRPKKHSLFSEDLSNSSISSKDDSFAEALQEAKKESLFEPTVKKLKVDGEKIKKEKSKKNKDKRPEKEEKKRKRKAERESPAEPPEKETKLENSKPEPSDSEPSPRRPQSDLDKENQENPEEYMEVLKDLQTKIVNLRDNTELQRVVQLIAQTGRYEVSQNTFDFDLCLLEKSTVKQLQEFFASS